MLAYCLLFREIVHLFVVNIRYSHTRKIVLICCHIYLCYGASSTKRTWRKYFAYSVVDSSRCCDRSVDSDRRNSRGSHEVRRRSCATAHNHTRQQEADRNHRHRSVRLHQQRRSLGSHGLLLFYVLLCTLCRPTSLHVWTLLFCIYYYCCCCTVCTARLFSYSATLIAASV